MLQNRRGLLLAGVAAFALLFVGATAARAQDAVVRGIQLAAGDGVDVDE